MGLEEIHTGQAVFIELVLGIGQVPRDSQLLAACVSFTRFWLESAMCLLNLFLFFFFVIILLFSWKLHTGINRANRSSPDRCPGHQDEDMEEILLSLEIC